MTTQLTEAGQKLANELQRNGLLYRDQSSRLCCAGGTSVVPAKALNAAAQTLLTPDGGGLRERLDEAEKVIQSANVAFWFDLIQVVDNTLHDNFNQAVRDVALKTKAYLKERDALDTKTSVPGNDAGMREADWAGASLSVRLRSYPAAPPGEDGLAVGYVCRLMHEAAAAIDLLTPGVGSLAPPTGSAGDDPKTLVAAGVGEAEGALGYATRLAQSLSDKHFPNPEWSPLPDLYGVLTQIDNMTTGLGRLTPQPPKAETSAGVGEPFDMGDCAPDFPSAVAVEVMGLAWTHAPGGDVDEHCDRYGAVQEIVDRVLRRPEFAALAPAARDGGGVERVRHLKRGTEYEVLGEAVIQIATENGEPSDGRRMNNYDPVMVYRSLDTGELWVRPYYEFRDGRFVTLTAAPAANGEGA